MKVLILAGGKATRLPHSTKHIPKSLVKIGNKPILQHQIDLLKKHGLTDVRLSLGYKAEDIIAYLKNQKNIEYLVESQPLGTGGAIKFASQNLKEDFMVLNGDVLSNIDFSEFIKSHKTFTRRSLGVGGTITVWYCKDCCDYGLIKLKNKQIIKFLEKPQKTCAGYINAGYYILSPSIFKNIKKTSFSIEKDIFPKLVQENKLMAYVHKGQWTDVGTEQRLKEARREFRAM